MARIKLHKSWASADDPDDVEAELAAAVEQRDARVAAECAMAGSTQLEAQKCRELAAGTLTTERNRSKRACRTPSGARLRWRNENQDSYRRDQMGWPNGPERERLERFPVEIVLSA